MLIELDDIDINDMQIILDDLLKKDAENNVAFVDGSEELQVE